MQRAGIRNNPRMEYRIAHNLLTLLPPQILLKHGQYWDPFLKSFLSCFMFHIEKSIFLRWTLRRILPLILSYLCSSLVLSQALAIYWQWSEMRAEFLSVSKGPQGYCNKSWPFVVRKRQSRRSNWTLIRHVITNTPQIYIRTIQQNKR